MLHRNPNKRPRLQQLMKEPFFAEIAWDKLEARQIDPPTVLKRSKVESPKLQQENEEMAMLFEQADDGDDE